MKDEPIPAAIREFILRVIDSVAHLEALLLLRAHCETPWDAASTAKRLYITEPQAAEVLHHLSQENLLSVDDGRYHYHVQPPEVIALIDRLASAYSKQLIPITNLIHAKPRRIREFADAFKFRKDR
jgi:hypothetical protein